MGASVSIGIEHSLQAGTATGADGVAPARGNTYGNGTGVGVTVAYEGLTVGAYVAERENKNPTAASSSYGRVQWFMVCKLQFWSSFYWLPRNVL